MADSADITPPDPISPHNLILNSEANAGASPTEAMGHGRSGLVDSQVCLVVQPT